MLFRSVFLLDESLADNGLLTPSVLFRFEGFELILLSGGCCEGLGDSALTDTDSLSLVIPVDLRRKEGFFFPFPAVSTLLNADPSLVDGSELFLVSGECFTDGGVPFCGF